MLFQYYLKHHQFILKIPIFKACELIFRKRETCVYLMGQRTKEKLHMKSNFIGN